MRLLSTIILGLFIICGEVYLGVQTFYPEVNTSQVDIIDDLIKEKKTIIDQMSDSDLAWLVNNPTVIVGADPHFYPLETFNERGQYTGLGGDYMRLLNHLTGINFQVLRQGDWATAEEMAQLRRVDMFMAIVKTDRRNEYMQFTDSYINLPGMIVVRRENKSDTLAIADLEGKKVAVVLNYFWHDYLLDNYPNISIVEAQDTNAALQMVANGIADAVIDYEFNLFEKMQIGGIYQLKPVGTVESDNGHAVAVRKDLPELFSIINLAMASVSEEERQSLADKWLTQAKPAGAERRMQWYFFFFTQAILLCIGLLAWTRSIVKDAVRAKVKSMKDAPLA